MSDYGLGTAEGKLLLDTSDYKRGFKEAGRESDQFARDQKRRSADIQQAGVGLLALGAVGAAGFAVAVKEAASFEERLSAVKAVSQATAEEMDTLRDKALQLGRDTAYGATEAAIAMEELVKAGLSVEDILNGAADATVALAAAGEIELPLAAEIAAASMNQFALDASQLPKVADLIAGAANASAIDVADFGQSIKQAGAVANLAGLSFEDTALAITAMGKSGIKGSDAGTSLKTFLQNLQPTTAAQIALFQELGLAIEDNATQANALGNAFYDSEGSIKSMTDISAALNGALDGMSDAQKTMALETIFGTDAIRAAGVLAGITEEEMAELQDTLGNTNAEDIAAERLNNLNGKMTIFKGSLQTLLIEVGTPFLGFLTELAEKATILVNKFLEMDEATRNLIVNIAGITSAVAGITGGLLVFAKFAGPLISIARLIGGLVAVFAGPLVIALKVIAAAVTSVGLVWVALIAGLVLAYFHIEEFRNFVDSAVRSVIAFGKAVYEWFVETAIPAVREFAEWFQNNVIPVIQEFVSSFIDAVMGIVDWLTGTLVPAVVDVAGKVQDALMSIWQWVEANVIPTVESVVELIVAIVERIVQFVELVMVPFWKAQWKIITTVLEAAWRVMKPVVEAGIAFLTDIINGFISVVGTAWNLFGDNLVSAITIAFDVIKGIVETVLGVIRGIAQVLTGIITLDWDKFTQGLATLWETVWNHIRTVFETIWAVIQLAVQTAIDLMALAWTIFTTSITTAWTAVWNGISAGFSALWTALTIILQPLWDALLSAWETITGAITTAWNTVWEGFASGIDALWNGIMNILQPLIDGLGDGWATFTSGLQSAWETVWNALAGAVDIVKGPIETAVNAIKSVIDPIISVMQNFVGLVERITDLNPFDGSFLGFGGTIDTSGIPELATGAIVKARTLAVVGEAGAEAVIPLTDQARAMQLLRQSGLADLVVSNLTGGQGGGSLPTSSSPQQASDVGPAVVVEEAHFYEQADIDGFMEGAQLISSGRSFE